MQKFAGDILLSWGWKRNGIAFLSGLVLLFALPPFNFFAIGFISFPVLLWLMEGASGSPGARGLLRHYRAAVTGWFFGFGYLVGGLWWISRALFEEGAAFLWALPLAVFALPAALAFFFALGSVFARMVWGRGIGAAAALAFGFGLSEWLRGILFTGFPWNGLAMTGMPAPAMMQATGVFGISGMNALVVFMFALPGAIALSNRRWLGPVFALVLMVANAGYGFYVLAGDATPPPALDAPVIRLVQPSIPQTDKWDEAERDNIFKTYLDLSAQPPAEGKPAPSLIIWPETAVPFLFADRPDALAALGDMLQDGQMLLAGSVRQEGLRENGDEVRFYNSMLLINDKGEIVDAADKVHLVPFGEYLPLENLLRAAGLRQIVTTPGGFSAGPRLRVLDVPKFGKFLPLICYEVIFPGVASTLKEKPDAIINITNDAWYGRTPGPWQHFRLAQLQAVESGLPLIRAANNGISGFIDGRGQVVSALDLDAIGAVDAAFLQSKISTVYSELGQSLVFAVFTALLAIAGLTNLYRRFNMSRSVY